MKKILLISGLLFSLYSYADDYKYLVTETDGSAIYINGNPNYITKNGNTYTVWVKSISSNGEASKSNLIINTITHQVCPLNGISRIPKYNYVNNCNLGNWIIYDSEDTLALVGNYLDKNYK